MGYVLDYHKSPTAQLMVMVSISLKNAFLFLFLVTFSSCCSRSQWKHKGPSLIYISLIVNETINKL